MDATVLDRARTHFEQGLARLQAGDAAGAEAALQEAQALVPGRPSVMLNLAVALLAQDRPEQALPWLDQVLQQQPDAQDALGHRGLALHQIGRPAEALQAFERLVQLAPAHADALWHLAQSHQVLGDAAAALQAYDRHLALRPEHAQAWSQRGGALRDLGRNDEAAASFERALALGSDAALDGWHLATLRGQAPAAPPRAFVERLFDDYAGGFEPHLVDTLDYRVPERLAQRLAGLGRAGFVSALDLGCGTGLCGPLLRPMSQRLEGVDLSAGMLERARAKGVYDALHHADLVEHLNGTAARHELVVAADVFIYVGDLSPVFAALERVLQPGGVLAFSVERADDPNAPWQLRETLRYAHGDAALHAQAQAHGLRPLLSEPGVLRNDQAGPVQGLCCLFERG